MSETLEQLPPLRRAPRANLIAAAPTQRRLVEIAERFPDSSLFDVLSCIKVSGDFDPGHLEPALRQVANRHGALRTSFERGLDGTIVQRCHDHAGLSWRRLALTDGSEAEVAAELRALAAGLLRQPFDLGRPELLRVVEAAASDGTRFVLLHAHHAIADGWSGALLRAEMKAICDGLAAGAAADEVLPRPPFQLADFTAWQNRWLEASPGRAGLAAWKSHLEGGELTTPLLGRAVRQPTRSVAGLAWHRASLPEHPKQALSQLAGALQATPFTILLALFGILLRAFSDTAHPAVATPFLNRSHPGTEGIFGFLANVLTLRLENTGDPPLSQHVPAVRQLLGMARRFQHVPPAAIVERLYPAQATENRQLSNLLFNYLPWTGEAPPAGGLQHSAYLAGVPLVLAGWYDLGLFVSEGRGRLDMMLVHHGDVLSGTEAAAFLTRYGELIELAVADPDLRIGRLAAAIAAHGLKPRTKGGIAS